MTSEHRKVLKLIKQEVEDNNVSRIQIFLNICNEMNYEDISETEIRDLFDRAATATSARSVEGEVDLDKKYVKMAFSINKKIWEVIPALLKTAHENQRAKNDAFNDILIAFGHEPVDEDDFYDWYENSGRGFQRPIPNKEYKKLMRHVLEEFFDPNEKKRERRRNFNNAFYECEKDAQHYTLILSNPRYAFQNKMKDVEEMNELMLVDLYHGEKKPLHFVDRELTKTSLESTFNQLVFLPNAQFLAFTNAVVNDLVVCHIHLLELDYEEERLKILTNDSVQFQASRFIVDEEGSENFGIITTFNAGHRHAVVGKIVDQKEFRFESMDTSLQLDPYMHCCKLSGQKIVGIHKDCTNSNSKANYWEFDLTRTGESRRRVIKFQFKYTDSGSFVFHTYTWHKNTCYVPDTQHEIHGFDTKTRVCTHIKINVHETIRQLIFDENENLIVQGEKRLKLFALKTPSSLGQIIWFSIRRQALFFEKKHLYEYAKTQLPLEYQPFGM